MIADTKIGSHSVGIDTILTSYAQASTISDSWIDTDV